MQQFYVSQSPDKVIVSMIEKKMINFIIISCYTQLQVFFQIKFHPGMKLYLFIQVCHVSSSKIASFHRFWLLKVMRNFRAPTLVLNLNECKVTTGKHICRSLFFNRVECWGYATLFKKSFDTPVFLLSFAQVLTRRFLLSICEEMFLLFVSQVPLSTFWLVWREVKTIKIIHSVIHNSVFCSAKFGFAVA